jgi:hypothetical protein
MRGAVLIMTARALRFRGVCLARSGDSAQAVDTLSAFLDAQQGRSKAVYVPSGTDDGGMCSALFCRVLTLSAAFPGHFDSVPNFTAQQWRAVSCPHLAPAGTCDCMPRHPLPRRSLGPSVGRRAVLARNGLLELVPVQRCVLKLSGCAKSSAPVPRPALGPGQSSPGVAWSCCARVACTLHPIQPLPCSVL